MIVNDRSNVRPGSVNFGMDEPLRIERAAFRVYGIPIEIEFDEIGCRDQFRRERSRHDEPVRGAIVASAHVAEAIEHALLSQDPICGDQVFDQCRIGRTRRCRRLRRQRQQYDGSRQKLSPCDGFCHRVRRYYHHSAFQNYCDIRYQPQRHRDTKKDGFSLCLCVFVVDNAYDALNF